MSKPQGGSATMKSNITNQNDVLNVSPWLSETKSLQQSSKGDRGLLHSTKVRGYFLSTVTSEFLCI